MSKLSRTLQRTLAKLQRARIWQGVLTEVRHPNGVLPDTVVPGDEAIYSNDLPIDCDHLSFPGRDAQSSQSRLQSGLCTEHQIYSAPFRFWASELHEEVRSHRKVWEFCFVLQALYERGMLSEGKRGLGFAVGEEPLPALMASMGCSILASDLDVSDDRATVWAETAQLASTLEGLNSRGLCDQAAFKERVTFRPIDMNRIPADARDFDFTWSSCSFEHCGSIELGKRFLLEQMKCLKPGGVAVHTTEYNLSSLHNTVEHGTTVIFRRKDVEAMIRELQAEGHEVEPLQLDLGSSEKDEHIDVLPYSDNKHLKLELANRYISTSIALIIRKANNAQQQQAVA